MRFSTVALLIFSWRRLICFEASLHWCCECLRRMASCVAERYRIFKWLDGVVGEADRCDWWWIASVFLHVRQLGQHTDVQFLCHTVGVAGWLSSQKKATRCASEEHAEQNSYCAHITKPFNYRTFNYLVINSLTTVGYSLEVFIRQWMPSMVRLLLGASTRNLSQGFIDTFSVGSRPWTHPLISEHSIVRTLRPENAPPD